MEDINLVIKGCLEGNRLYQESLYSLFSKKMYTLCLRYSKNEEEAKDILQDGFIKIFEKIDQFGYRGSFEGWIRKIMVNTALEQLRKKNDMFVTEEIKPSSTIQTAEDLFQNISATELLSLIQQLSPQYRMVFNLFAIEGYSHKEIAEKLGISEGTSKSNFSRAREILQQRVSKVYPGITQAQ